MKALVFDKSKYKWEDSRGFELVDVPKPKIETDDDVLIKVHYAGVCGSDKGIWYRQAFKEQILGSLEAESNNSVIARGNPRSNPNEIATPLAKASGLAMTNKLYRIIGHEFFGEVVEVGSKVKNVKKGDFVSCESHVVDNKCYNCLRGQKEVCMNEKILGISHDGGFAEYARVPAHIVWKTDTSKIRPEVAAMQEPFGNAVHAASQVDLKGKTIAIFGLGPIGMFLLLVARARGTKHIIGVEPNPVAIEMAKKLGIDYVIPLTDVIASEAKQSNSRDRHDPSGLAMTDFQHNSEITDEIMKITKGVGVDVSFEMAGFNSSVNNCLYATRRGGDIILFGIKAGDFVIENYNRLIVHGFTLHAVIGRQIWQTWETTRALLSDSSNQMQEKLFNVILDRGGGTILPLGEYTKERFEQMMHDHPKFLIQM